jgi:hypothetical protein
MDLKRVVDTEYNLRVRRRVSTHFNSFIVSSVSNTPTSRRLRTRIMPCAIPNSDVPRLQGDTSSSPRWTWWRPSCSLYECLSISKLRYMGRAWYSSREKEDDTVELERWHMPGGVRVGGLRFLVRGEGERSTVTVSRFSERGAGVRRP